MNRNLATNGLGDPKASPGTASPSTQESRISARTQLPAASATAPAAHQAQEEKKAVAASAQPDEAPISAQPDCAPASALPEPAVQAALEKPVPRAAEPEQPLKEVPAVFAHLFPAAQPEPTPRQRLKQEAAERAARTGTLLPCPAAPGFLPRIAAMGKRSKWAGC